MSPVEAYLVELHAIHAARVGTPETSYYPALANLLDAIGRQLKPRVRGVMQLASRGAGIPDGGLFTAEQFQQVPEDGILAHGPLPARGVIEAKGTAVRLADLAVAEQTRRYLDRYGQVLITNLREFGVLTRGPDGAPQLSERIALAADEAAFWSTPAPRLAEQCGAPLQEFLKRALLANAPLMAPEDVAWFLASYARDARGRIERASPEDLAALEVLKAALETALGLKFEGDRGEHFYHSTLVQTLFYGTFSAWVLWSRDHLPTDRAARFDWRPAAWNIALPVIQSLFVQIATPEILQPLGLDAILDRTADALNRVDRAAFFARFEAGTAVQYFYEPFLEAFDPELRKDLGVWYTPPEIVRYMVGRVDALLREELGIARGLADEQVIVLDPCCGTGAYLVEALRLIAERLRAEGGEAFLAEDLRQAATQRIFGFELLSAPFVVAHMQISLLLRQLGAPLGKTDRAGIYLTNALIGWDKIGATVTQARVPQMDRERLLVGRVKQEAPVLVVLGNPPYNGYAGVGITEERALSDAYRTVRQVAAPQGQGLNDLYVRFFRMAERRIVEQTKRGIVCFISNYSWLDGLSHTDMRERYLEAFDQIWIDCLNGDKYKTGKLTPEGAPDPSVFSTEFNTEGIQVGTAITLLARHDVPRHREARAVHFRHFWGKTKRADLVASLTAPTANPYTTVTPPLELGLPFMPMQVRAAYLTWPRLPELFPISFPGIQSSRDDVVVDIDREKLVQRMERYFDPRIGNEEMQRIMPEAMGNTARFQAIATREYLLRRGFLPQNIFRYIGLSLRLL